MNSFILYILQVSLVFGVFYALFKWIFSRFTFHALNRSFLLLLIPLAILLPICDTLFPTLPILNFEIPLMEEFTAFTTFEEVSNQEISVESQTISYSFWLLTVYFIGVFMCLSRFVTTTYAVFKLKRNATKIQWNDTTIFASNVNEVFSYFGWIFIPKSESKTIANVMITHEKAHVRLLHSVDVVLVEVFIAFFWFHPLAYSYRKSLKSIHEFQADASVLNQHVKKSTYLELLLKSLEPKNTNPVYSYFSHPTLKKRIEMITKSQSKARSKFMYLLLIPVISLVFMAFVNSNTTTILTEFMPENSEVFISKPSLFPVQNGNVKNISSKYGIKRKHPKLKDAPKHGGIDIKAKEGTPVVATADGIILKAEKEGNWGNLIVISHADGFETWYAHLKGFNTKSSQTVKKGDIIGYVGNTGLSTAPHLHYEVRQHGKRLNPMDYIIK